jgi:acetate kinase
MMAVPVILCLNSGSSSLKFALYRLTEGADTALVEGTVERIGLPNGRLAVHSQASGRSREDLGAFHDPQAAEAVDMFCYQLRKTIGALTTVLGGLDTLVFTGGIGEHAAPVRSEVCQGLAYLGIHLDPQQNARHASVISAAGSRCIVRVVPTNEDLMIARHTSTLLFSTHTATR